MRSVVLNFVLLIFTAVAKRESWLVQTLQGPVRGYKNEVYNIFEFYGIPYATTPTGAHRFKAPLPPPTWTDPLDAIDKRIKCPQKDFMGFMPDTIEKENCLIANIYLPVTKQTSVPVVVYVFGGAYVYGYGNLLTPKEFVAQKNTIVVTFNYRVSAHGFLCLGTEDIPGNAGMKDQVALLRWVKKNIASFGGNSEDITLAGYSSGSSSVDLLMISKMTKGLFKRVIPESGANIAAYSIQPDPLQSAKEYAKLLNFTNIDDVYALEDFFKSVPVETLNALNLFYRQDGTTLFAACVERETEAERFLDDDPVNILKRGDYEKLPMLYGFTDMEGLFFIHLFDFWKDKMNVKFSDWLPADLQFENELQKEKVANKIKQFYFGDKPVAPDTILGFVDYFSDIYFTYPILRSVKLQVEAGNNNIYLYEYSYVDDNTPFVPHTNARGSGHCGQSSAVLDFKSMPHNPIALSEQYLKMVDKMRSIWHSFITTGNPIPPNSGWPEWPPVGVDCSPHMSLNHTIELRGTPIKERKMFWDDIYENYYRRPIPPPPPPPKYDEL